MKILVTGATGFIGGAIVDALLEERHEVHGLVRRTSKAERLREKGIKLIYGDITDPASLDAIAGAFDALFHCAAYVEDKNWRKLRLVNVQGTENVCKLCARLKVGRLIYLSSVAVVSGHRQVPLTEDLPFCANNRYGRSKLEAEKIVRDYRARGLAAAIFRPPMVYGETEPHMLKTLLAMIKYRLLPVIGSGNNKLHMVYVKNLAQAAVMALRGEEFLEGSYFVADKEALTSSRICSILAEGISAPRPVVLPASLVPFLKALPWLGKRLDFFLKDRVYDISRIERLGYKPKFKAEEALAGAARFNR